MAAQELRAHALLSASGAHRWMACPGSAILEDTYEDETSSYAEEGTFAHTMACLKLQVVSGEISKRSLSNRMVLIRKDPKYNQEMEEYIDGYVANIIERLNAAKARCKDAKLLLEQRLDFSVWVPDGFGTGDVVIIAEPIMEVIDLKYGAGVAVSAISNPQPRLYGLGAWQMYSHLYDIENIRMTIIQPRLDDMSTEELTAEELLTWGVDEVVPKAQQALHGGGGYHAGEHCRFCKAKATCRARGEANLELAKYDFQEGPTYSDEEIADILGRIDELVNWAGHIKDYALAEALGGKHWPGWKLVEGTSKRKYADEVKVAETLEAAGFGATEIYNWELLGITAMEKLTGKKKFAEVLGDLVVKPAGKPTLAPETDKRPALNTAAAAAQDFQEPQDLLD